MKNVRFVEFCDIQKRKIDFFFFAFAFALKSRICKEFTNLVPESQSRIREDHEL